jgi:hypothetical protein
MPSAIIADHLWLVIVAQIAGVLSAAMTRISEGSKNQTSFQALFIGTLLAVGLITISGVRLGPAHWMISGTTMAIMLLLATCDFGYRVRRGD